jgi:protein-S-isoprenylcysteine O-methyltransferase Ste14
LLSLITPAVMGAVVFVSAGRMDLPFVWAYVGIVAMGSTIAMLLLDPGLIRERMRPGPGAKDTNDVGPMKVLIAAHLVVAGLDVGRLHWSDGMADGLRVAGLCGVAAGFGLGLWSMVVNPFFSALVRIQEERGHAVVTRGPYGVVRHPGYAGYILGFAASPLALGSWYSGVPALVFCLLLWRRTRIEDRFLLKNLPGYGAYAERVRFRLVPGVW